MKTPQFQFSTVAISVFAILGAMSASPVLHAQEAEAAEENERIETIAITGSRIARADQSNSPVQVIDEEALNIRGALSLGEILQELPSVGASLNSNGTAGTSHGASSLNLRNLGENRSLVLVNGQRWVNGAGTRGFRDFVDLNTIPSIMINRVEVLQDGATAIYGADAIAGVVNMYTHRDYVGTQVKAFYGESSRGDRESVNVDVLHGQDFGNNNFMVAFSYADQKPIFSQDRSLTAVPLNGLSFGTTEGIIRAPQLQDLYDFDTSGGITRNPGSDGMNPDSWRQITANDRYNRWDNNYVMGPSTRTSVFAQYLMPLDKVNVRLEALFNRRESDQQFSPAPPAIFATRGMFIPNNPDVNPFGVELGGSGFRIDNYFDELGPRVNAQTVDTSRIGVSFDGYINANWDWDAFVSYARNRAEFVSNNQINLDNLALGLRACDTTGVGNVAAAAGCVPVNIFNDLTPAMADYIRFTGRDTNESRQTNANFNVSGFITELPAGDLQMAAGIEYRKEEGIDTPDSFISSEPQVVSGDRRTSSAPRTGTRGDYDLYEAYAEFSIPLLADRAGIDMLELTAAGRFSDYSTFGSTFNTKFGLSWRVNDDVMFRGTFAEGFRAPSVLELFEGQRSTFAPVADPCSGGANLPGCSGVPNDYVQGETQVPATVGGNNDLQPETSENVSVGLVYTPQALSGFSFTLDYFDIQIDDTISTFGAQNLVNLCANTGRNCGVITRNNSGEIINIIDGPVNLNSTSVKGIDAVGRYNFDTDLGNWDVMLSVSKLEEFKEVSTLADGSSVVDDRTGRAFSREAYPEWRSNLNVQWRRDAWYANYSWRHIGDSKETFQGEDRKIGSVFYHNAAVAYDFSNGLTARVGMNNITDKQPPVSRVNININFDINTYNPVGRFSYVQLVYNF
ncbi:TonB-dependent receptor [Aliidiomarina sp.]|uniref:TonB-dependent receptor n=1 Tax=Aliidiomarina sp. TaxID=1872439 RepID=UPI003A4DE58D